MWIWNIPIYPMTELENMAEGWKSYYLGSDKEIL